MTRRLVAVLAPPPVPGFPSAGLRAAMVEDGYETVAGLELVEPVLALGADPADDDLQGVVWPGTPVLRLPERTVTAALAGLAALGADEATVVAGDVPDLPGLLIGKLHRGLGSAEVAVLPAADGGLVALATRCPVPDWVRSAAVDLDSRDALDLLRAAAPRRTAVSVGPGWHRVRVPSDVASLDPGLEGWDLTRQQLGRG